MRGQEAVREMVMITRSLRQVKCVKKNNDLTAQRAKEKGEEEEESIILIDAQSNFACSRTRVK